MSISLAVHSSRKLAGLTIEIQLIAVNVDFVFLAMSLNHDFNVRRLERYLLAAWDSRATPIVEINEKRCLRKT